MASSRVVPLLSQGHAALATARHFGFAGSSLNGVVPLSRSGVAMHARQNSTMKAVVFDGNGASIDTQRQRPKLDEDSVIVRPVAVALNPTDWKNVRYKRAKPGCIVGCDYAGIVEAVGSAVQKSWRPGDRIFGCAHGANPVNPDGGVFAEVAVVKGDLQMRIPEGMDFTQAATLGLGTITVGQGLYQKAMQLDLPSASAPSERNRHEHVLIYGGGTSTAALAIQFAKLSGYSVITICGEESFDYVKRLGADLALDYRDADVGAKVRRYTDNKLRYAWDTIGADATARICGDALTDSPDLSPAYGTINPKQCPRSDVKSTTTVMYTVFGKDIQFGTDLMPGSKEDFEFGKKFYGIAEGLIRRGLVKPHRHRLAAGGLEGIPKGLKDLEDGKVRGEKLVYLVNKQP